jgi:hypothetical protein
MLPSNPPKKVMTGNVDYSGGKNKRRRAALSPTNGNQSKMHGQPIQEASNQNWTPTNVVTPYEFVSPYSATLPDALTFGGPEDINVPTTNGIFNLSSKSPFSLLPLGFLPFLGLNHSSGSNSSFVPPPPIAAPELSTLISWPIAGGILLFGLSARRRAKVRRP